MLSRALTGQPWPRNRYTHYFAIEVAELEVLEGRDHVFVVLNDKPLDITGRIAGKEVNEHELP